MIREGKQVSIFTEASEKLREETYQRLSSIDGSIKKLNDENAEHLTSINNNNARIASLEKGHDAILNEIPAPEASIIMEK